MPIFARRLKKGLNDVINETQTGFVAKRPLSFKVGDRTGFGPSFIQVITMFYKTINSCVTLYPNTTSRFSVQRSDCQGCPVAPFLFLLVEMLSLYILNSTAIEGICIFHRKLKITQPADDTALFLEDSQLVNAAISLVETFY